MLEEAKQLAEKLRAAETISRSDVEKAMLDKLCNVKDMKQGEIDLKKQIENIDSQLESLHEELAEIQKYRVCYYKCTDDHAQLDQELFVMHVLL